MTSMYMQYVTSKRNKSIEEMLKERNQNKILVDEYYENGIQKHKKCQTAAGKIVEIWYDPKGRGIKKDTSYPDGGHTSMMCLYDNIGRIILSAEKGARYAESVAYLELNPWWTVKFYKDSVLRIVVQFDDAPTEAGSSWWYDASPDERDKETQKFPGLRLDDLILETKSSTYDWEGCLTMGNAYNYHGENRVRKGARLAEKDFVRVYEMLLNMVTGAEE